MHPKKRQVVKAAYQYTFSFDDSPNEHPLTNICDDYT
jgi:hypothetical protein